MKILLPLLAFSLSASAAVPAKEDVKLLVGLGSKVCTGKRCTEPSMRVLDNVEFALTRDLEGGMKGAWTGKFESLGREFLGELRVRKGQTYGESLYRVTLLVSEAGKDVAQMEVTFPSLESLNDISFPGREVLAGRSKVTPVIMIGKAVPEEAPKQ